MSAQPQKSNILFIVVDSLRSDSFHGDAKTSITPNIDRLIQQGALFKKTISSIPATKIATACIMTSLYPFKLGKSDDNFFKIKPSLITNIKVLKDNSYHAYAKVPDMFSTTGLLTDFENENKTFDNFTGRLDNSLGNEIINELKSNKLKQPWIYYIHLLDLIRPTIATSEFNDKKYGKDQYERIISMMDHWIGQIMQNIDLDKTLIVVTADHGNYLPSVKLERENFSFEPSFLHRFIWKSRIKIPQQLQNVWLKVYNFYKIILDYKITKKISSLKLSPYQKRIFLNIKGHTRDIHDDCLIIPFLISGHSIKKRMVEQQVRQVDIFPTILDILNIKLNHKIDGKSLSPLLSGERYSSLPCYIENLPTRENGWKKIIGLRTEKYKYGRCSNSNTDLQLYDLEKDPFEETNLATVVPTIINELESILQNILNQETEKQFLRRKISDNIKKLAINKLDSRH